MSKNIKIFVGILIVIIAIIFAIFYWQKSNKQSSTNVEGIILFYSTSCPHCAALEEWMVKNNIEASVEISKLEVSANKDNQKLLGEKATICKIATDSIGVPFLWTGTDCILGDEPIEQFFKQKLNINESTATNETNEVIQ